MAFTLNYRINRILCLLTRAPRTTSDELSAHTETRNQNKLIKAAITNSVADSVSFSGNIPSLFLLVLGGNPVHIGLLATLKHSFQLAKIIGLKLLPLFGKARLCAWGRLLSALPLLALAVLAAWPGDLNHLVLLAILMFTLRGFIVTGGNTGWQPLIQDSTNPQGIGNFFGRMRLRLRTVDLIVPLVLGLFLGATPSARRFIPLFLLKAAVKIAGSFFFSGIIEKKMAQQQDTRLIDRFASVMRKRSVRHYGFFSIARMFVFTAYHPLWVVMLNDHGIGASQLVWLGAAAAFGNIVGVRHWGMATDRLGSRWIISLTIFPQAALGAIWLTMPIDNIKMIFVCGLFLYLAHGFLNGGLGMAKTIAMIHSIPRTLQAEGFVVSGYMQALGGAAGGVFGGLVFRWTSTLEELPFALDPRHLYLAAMQFCLIPVWLLSRNLKERKAD